jgi:hypothetical protein
LKIEIEGDLISVKDFNLSADLNVFIAYIRQKIGATIDAVEVQEGSAPDIVTYLVLKRTQTGD